MDELALPSRIIAGCLILAFLLHFGVTQWGTQHATVYCDHRTAVTGGPPGQSIFVFGRGVADTMGGLAAGLRRDNNCGVRAFDTATGLFTRWGLSPLIAILTGVLAPGLLGLASLAAVARTYKTRIVALAGAALFLFSVMVRFDAEWAQYRGTGQNRYLFGPYIEKRIDPPIIETGVSADACKSCDDFLLWGFYPRENIPRGLAMWGGMAIPLSIMIIVIGAGLRSLFRRRMKT